MNPNDLERAAVLGLRLTRGAVGLGVSLALAPARLVLRAIHSQNDQPEPVAWQPPPQPAPPPPIRLREEADLEPEPAIPFDPEIAAEPEPTPPAPEPLYDVPATNDLSAAEAARMREAEREEAADGDSPGPEIRVEEPWEGYDAMTIAQILDRLTGADVTLRVMVRLYEETHKNRRGVLRATE
jgi:hypothetical protein